jgi:hypothetical protein
MNVYSRSITKVIIITTTPAINIVIRTMDGGKESGKTEGIDSGLWR